MMTLHQLRIFWAVAHAESLTKASKQLGLAQPSLSQQLAKLESSVSVQLFDRSRNQMELTDAGRFLLRKAELILEGVDEAIVGLEKFGKGTRGVIALGGLNSIARVVVPEAFRIVADRLPDLELDIHELAPAEALELLYGRRINIALLASNSIAKSSSSFQQIDVLTDPYVLAAPSGLDLSGIADPDKELSKADRKIVNSCIQFNFGTQHARRVEHWYQHVLPHYKRFAQVRTYEVALSLVRAGLGVALVPALTAHPTHEDLGGITLYAVNQPKRRIVALVPSQYARVEPYSVFLAALQEAGRRATLPPIEPAPPFLARDPEATS